MKNVEYIIFSSIVIWDLFSSENPKIPKNMAWSSGFWPISSCPFQTP
jgi:hypothetical protein